ncbi:hypothetical protein HUJ04_005705 [Dendroctonus ponderosae]
MSVNPVCRTCLVIIPDGKTGHNLDDEDTSDNMREIITLCVPEMDTYVSSLPSICDSCYDILLGFYRFKVRCLQVESAIRSYIDSNNLQECSTVDLRHVARLQALDALKQKNWSPHVGRKLIASVDKCLDPKKAGLKRLGKFRKRKMTASSFVADQKDGSLPEGYIRVRTNLMPDRQGPSSNLTVNPLNIWASKAAAKKKGYNALQLCPKSGVLKKVNNKASRRVSESDDVIFVDSQKASDDEVVLINDDQDDRPEANSSNAPKRLKRKLDAPIVLDKTVSKRQKLQLGQNSRMSSGQSKTGEKKLVVKLRNERLFKCNCCQYVALEPMALQTHYFQLHRMCKLCNFKCSKKPTLNNHISQKHRRELQLACKFFQNNVACDFVCSLCRFAGKNLVELVQHRLAKHIKMDHKLGAYQCPFVYCQFHHENATNVAEHVAAKHDKPDRKECLMCNFVGTSVDKINKHVQSHDLTFCPCPICGYKCKKSLDQHMQKNHPGVDYDDGTTVGVVYDDGIQFDRLTSNDDFKITLGPSGLQSHSLPQSVGTARTADEEETYHWAQPSLSEMLCGHLLSQENNISEVSDESAADQAAKPKSGPTNGRKRKRDATNDDSDDCVLVETERMVVTVESSEEEDSVESNKEDATKTHQETSLLSGEEHNLSSSTTDTGNLASSEESPTDPILSAADDGDADKSQTRATECLENGVNAEEESSAEKDIRDPVSESETPADSAAQPVKPLEEDMEKAPEEKESVPLENCAEKSV